MAKESLNDCRKVFDAWFKQQAVTKEQCPGLLETWEACWNIHQHEDNIRITDDRVCIAGNWYMPVKEVHQTIQTIIGTLEPIKEGNWRVTKAIKLLRSVGLTEAKRLEEAKELGAKVPCAAPDMGDVEAGLDENPTESLPNSPKDDNLASPTTCTLNQVNKPTEDFMNIVYKYDADMRCLLAEARAVIETFDYALRRTLDSLVTRNIGSK